MEENLLRRIVQRLDPRQPETKNWLVVFYLVFASYLLYDGAVFLLSPDSGRIRTFVCAPDATQQNICTVTIYGFRQIYRRSFPAEEFIGAHVTMACCTVHGITFSTRQGKIEFIPTIESGSYIYPIAKEINDQFIDGRPTPTLSVTYNGLSPLLYWRGVPLILGLGILLLGRRARRPWFGFDATRLSQARGYALFAIYWARNNFLFLLLFSLNITGGWASIRSICPMVMPGIDRYCAFSTSYLLCFYPLAALLLLRSLVQMHMLTRLGLRISLGWLAAPLLASALPMVVAPQFTSDQCQSLAFPIFGLFGDPGIRLVIGVAGYYLLTGLIQWLVLRRHLRTAVAWVFMPLIQASLPVLMGMMVSRISNPSLLNDLGWFIFPAGIAFFLLVMFTAELVPGLCMSWLVRRQKPGDGGGAPTFDVDQGRTDQLRGLE